MSASWGALWELGVKDAAGNVAVGDVQLEGATNCYVRSDGMLTGVIGLTDAVVVVTEDAVLAMHRDAAQDVKKLVDRLKAARPARGGGAQPRLPPVGLLREPDPGRAVPGQAHRRDPGAETVAAETLSTAPSTGWWSPAPRWSPATRETVLLHENESIYVPLGAVHRLENPGKIPLTLIEVQSGAYLGEDDIVRLEDTYGRA